MSDLSRDNPFTGDAQRRRAIDRLGDLSRDITRAQCVGWMAERLENP